MTRTPGFDGEAALYRTRTAREIWESPVWLPPEGVFPQLPPEGDNVTRLLDYLCGGDDTCRDAVLGWAFGPGSPSGTPTGGSFPVSGDDSDYCRPGYRECTCDPGPPLRCTKDWVNARCEITKTVLCTPKKG